MKLFRFGSLRCVVGLCFVLVFALETALLSGCAVFSTSPSTGFSLDEKEKKEAEALSLLSQGLLQLYADEAKKGSNDVNRAVYYLNLFARACDTLPQNRDLLVAFVTSLENTHLYTNGYQAVSRYLTFSPDDEEMQQMASYFAASAGMYPEAISHCKRVIELSPTNRTFTAELVRLQLLSKDDSGALRTIREEWSRYHDEEAQHLPMGKGYALYSELKEPARAIPYLQLAHQYLLSLDPESKLRSSIGILEGKCLAETGRTNEAMRVYLETYRNDPEKLSAIHLASELLPFSDKRFDSLRTKTQRAYVKDEDLLLYISALQRIRFVADEPQTKDGLNHFLESLPLLRRYYTRSSEERKTLPVDFYNWHIATYECLSDLEKEHKSNGLHDLPAYRPQHLEAYSWKETERLVREAIKVYPDEPSFKNYLAYSWALRKENLEEANRLVNQALAVDPKCGAYLDTKGWVLFQSGRPYQALQLLFQAAENTPDDEIFDHIRTVLTALGKKREAEAVTKFLQKRKQQPKE
ncbi:MAG: hypothetical protein IKR48_01970 [Kiritimatiellae bacterium]|nr:hypothetical protein [Kiritimatiellia bacterium]